MQLSSARLLGLCSSAGPVLISIFIAYLVITTYPRLPSAAPTCPRFLPLRWITELQLHMMTCATSIQLYNDKMFDVATINGPLSHFLLVSLSLRPSLLDVIPVACRMAIDLSLLSEPLKWSQRCCYLNHMSPSNSPHLDYLSCFLSSSSYLHSSLLTEALRSVSISSLNLFFNEMKWSGSGLLASLSFHCVFLVSCSEL